MTIQIYAMTYNKYGSVKKRYVCTVFVDNLVFVDNFDCTWFTAFADGKGVMSGEVSHLHGKGNKEFEFIRDLR